MKIINVMAVSVDGKIAAHPLESDAARRAYGFTNTDDQEHVRRQLQQADAVITGANSLRASGATWEVTNQEGRCADWIVLTRQGLDPGLKFWHQNKVRRTLVSPEALPMPENTAVENWTYGSSKPGRFVVERLQSQGARQVLLFGGAEINKIFYSEGLVDEIKITICPIIIAQQDATSLVTPGLPEAIHLTLQSSQVNGNLVFLNYKVATKDRF